MSTDETKDNSLQAWKEATKPRTIDGMVRAIRHEVISGMVAEDKLPNLHDLKLFCKAERKRLKKLKHAGVPQSEWNKNI